MPWSRFYCLREQGQKCGAPKWEEEQEQLQEEKWQERPGFWGVEIQDFGDVESPGFWGVKIQGFGM